ncbi:hypothetical protein BGZ49_008908 [Haplosporangium sp. Z 27]|nr:hypothetical protein BGZ49_008908 [Haplosporangium sp. Z 27]
MNSRKPSTTTVAKQRPSPYARPGVLLSNNKVTTSPAVPSQIEPVPVNDLVQFARKSFSAKDFTAAVQYLTRALTIAPKDINLLDSRATSLEKLGRFNDALADTKTMIEIHPNNPKGYLRAGKIFRLQQNFKSSAKIYIAGVERCDSSSKEFETLTRIAKEMSAKLEDIAKAEARVLDPVERLPYELVMHIFGSLSFTERVRCLTISKKWMNYLGSIREFWQSIDLAKRTPLSQQIPYHSLYTPILQDQEDDNKVINRTVLSLVKYTPPRALRLGGVPQLTGNLFTQLTKMRRAAALETLSLRRNAKIYDQEYSLFWSATPKLRYLDLHGCHGVMDGAVVSVLERCPLLEELDISVCRITEACMMINSGIPLPNMKKLIIGRWEMPFAKEGIDALVSRFPNLITLDIRTMRPRGIEALESISQLKYLKHLYTESIETSGDAATSHVLQQWVAGIQNLESLQMNACKGVSDLTIQLIAAGSGEPGSTRRGWSHSLRMLDLSFSPYLTSEGLGFLRTNPLPHLHTLNLNKCSRVSELGLRHAVTSSGVEICKLECAGYPDLSDKLLNDIKDHCPKIEVLQISNSGSVSGIGLMALVNERGRGLKRVFVDNCSGVSVDAVERARVVLGEKSRVSYGFNRSHR